VVFELRRDKRLSSRVFKSSLAKFEIIARREKILSDENRVERYFTELARKGFWQF